MEQRVEMNLKDVSPTPEALEAYLKVVRTRYMERNKKTRSGALEATHLITQLKERRQSLIEKNLEGLYPDDMFREQLGIIDRKLAEAYLQQKEAGLKEYNLEELMEFAKSKLADLKTTYENSSVSQRKSLLGSIFPKGMVWGFPGISNPEISSLYQPIQHPEMLHIQYGDA